MVNSSDSKTRWMTADLEYFPDNDNRYEIIDGELYVTRAPHWKHQDTITNLCKALANWVTKHQQGKVLT